MSRATSFSEFRRTAPTSFMTRMQSQNVAKVLLSSRKARKLLPKRRMPSYPEFRRLMKAVYLDRRASRDAKGQPLANMVSIYNKLVEMRQAQLDRKHCKSIKATINSRPPIDSNSLILERTSVLEDLQKKQEIFRHNLQLLSRINRSQRLHGIVDCFNTTYERGPSSRHRERVKAERLSRDNRDLGCRLAMAKSKVDCYNPWVPPLPPIELKASQQTLVKYTPFIPSPQTGQIDPQALLRPLLYYDLVVGDNQPLGRISIQLYTEVSPEVVLEFVRLATYNDVQGHRFLRIFAELWMEGELVLGSRDALRHHHSTRDQSQLDHTRLTGFLSYAWDYHHHFPQGLLNYSISFKPLAVVSLQRIVFGRVFGGHRVLQLCQAYGTKNGKPKSHVTIAQCGLL
ncbi:uncharacterized protein LOC117579062 [Drosophila guanche]|uniref:PPIase cyclophilin-type domain-containing protein n=1 Tax=Drosophila guanche TaxID=7266 RepID=A0A3B0J653_DROGU|nr:uncharacterized protein LOC117579062 [Drosophila guanche]SPP77574.1 Hypothetical predicted protein [Drosophila guanche]